MRYISCEEMKKIDHEAITKLGIPSIVLMENAAIRSFDNIDKSFTSFTIVCGVGNNGGDGLAIARHLFLNNKHVDLFILGNLSSATEDFKINFNIVQNLGIKPILISDNTKELVSSILNNDACIDSIFGIGLTRNIEGIYKDVIDAINEYSRHTISIDISSGLNGDTGEIMACAIKPDLTISFHAAKHGHKNQLYTGKLIVVPISIAD